MISILLQVMALLGVVHTASGFKILVVPYAAGFNSRLLNVQKIADILAEDGHQVSVLMNSDVIDHVISKHADVIEYKVPESILGVDDVAFEQSSWTTVFKLFDELTKIEFIFCEYLLQDKSVMAELQSANYDLIFADIGSMCSQVLVANLNTTTIYYLNFASPVYREFFYPVFPSFVCTLPGMTCIDENMSFSDKILNFLMKLMTDYYSMPGIYESLTGLAERERITLHKPIKDSWRNKVAVVNAHYALDTPMPTMPHVFPISGLFHKKPSPLPKDFSDIVKASEPHGTILMSFGTLMPDFDAEKADMFARVLGRLPHKIIWRFTGKPPKSLKPNTHLVKWFPQNDLLANPSLKLFITHCGISSTFETSLHGVPVLAMPLFADQDGNAAKLINKLKLGVQLDFYSVTEEEFEQGLMEILSNPVFAENAQRASYLLNDHVVSPQQQLRHLVNFTIKSGGVPHLFHPYALDMNWFQFYGLDVFCFLMSVFLLILSLLYLLAKLCINCLKQYFLDTKFKQP